MEQTTQGMIVDGAKAIIYNYSAVLGIPKLG